MMEQERPAVTGYEKAVEAALDEQKIAVYVPATMRLAHVKAGSAIVGTPFRGGVLVDYEGNLHGAANLKTYADRALHAWGRHVKRYPTVARALVEPYEVVQVGSFDPEAGVVAVFRGTQHGALKRWLGVDDLDEAELLCTGAKFGRPS